MFIKTTKTFLTIVLLLSVTEVFVSPATAEAAETSSAYKIKSVSAQHNGTVVVLDGFVYESKKVKCGDNTFFLEQNASNAATLSNFLLMAYIHDKPITVTYFKCVGQDIKLGGVRLGVK
ncbi:MAG: hypothetical protein PVF82_17535 [Gammaproteobacteria bacterium]|jgi:hypothetical protein